MKKDMINQQIVQEGIKSSPPLAVSGLSVYGVEISALVYLATLIYITLQILFLLVDRVGKKKEELNE